MKSKFIKICFILIICFITTNVYADGNSYNSSTSYNEMYVKALFDDGDEIIDNHDDLNVPYVFYQNIGGSMKNVVLNSDNNYEAILTNTDSYLNNPFLAIWQMNMYGYSSYIYDCTSIESDFCINNADREGLYILNTRLPEYFGSLSITSNLLSNSDDTELFITITLDDETVNGLYGDVEFVDGVGTCSISLIDTINIKNLRGAYNYVIDVSTSNKKINVIDKKIEGVIELGSTNNKIINLSIIQAREDIAKIAYNDASLDNPKTSSYLFLSLILFLVMTIPIVYVKYFDKTGR